MGFSPIDVRQAQLSAAEALLHTVEPAKAYPADFVVYRVTGYRPKDVSADMLAGEALQHDLGLLIERVSETLDLVTATTVEPVLSIDDVVERFNVASKTIQRWRRRGLPARRFLFSDNKRRVGFLLSSVERFVAANGNGVASEANTSAVLRGEIDDIVRHARRLATECGCDIDVITRRLARRFHRSPLTILHTLRKHDADHASDAVLPLATSRIDDARRARIIRARKRGRSLASIARKFDASLASVHRVLLDERIVRLSRRKAKFIDDPLYHADDADAAIEEIARIDGALSDVGNSTADARVPRDLPPYLQQLYRTPLLSPQQERALFLKFNYHKFRFATARRQLDPQLARSRELRVLEGHLAAANETKNAIVRANLRLVISVARKHLRSGLSLMELASDGNITLMRAVESFDLHHGHKFSTYATLALMKGFARSVPAMGAAARRSTGLPGVELHSLPDSRFPLAADRLGNREEVSQLLARLGGREREVVRSRFGINDRGMPASVDEVALAMGLSVQRVRQIERAAIVKLRAGC